MPVQIGLADEADFPHRGVVDFTDNRVDLNTGTLRFRAKIDNPADAHGNRFIVPGLFVRVRLPIGDPHPALMVREQALVSDQGRKTVYVIKEQGRDKEGKNGPDSPWCATSGTSACCATDTARSRRGSSRATGWSSRGCSGSDPGSR